MELENIMPSETSQSQKTKRYKIPLMWNRHIHRDRLEVTRDWGEGGGGVIASWVYFLFGVMKTVLEVDSEDGCTTLWSKLNGTALYTQNGKLYAMYILTY